MKKLVFAILLATLLACTPKERVIEHTIVETRTVQDPGSVEHVWEPQMIDSVETPPGLDPEGVYYRPAHEEVVEIRPGRWRYKETLDTSN